ncbi:MAG: hypothetical protein K6T75_08780 [Acetobacteraceae bacterium]|nr:hypothetical protein [Acetobacteraceae bacterium]
MPPPGHETAAPLGLKPVLRTSLEPTPPYSLKLTAFKPSHFPSANVRLQGDAWYQALCFEGVPLGVKLWDKGEPDHPRVGVAVFAERDPGPGLLARLASELRHRYDMDSDVTDFYRRFSPDPLLGPLLSRYRGMRVSAAESLFEFLVVAVVLRGPGVRRLPAV